MQLCSSNEVLECIQLNKDNVKEVMKFYGFDIDNLKNRQFVDIKDYGVECGVEDYYRAKIPYGYWLVYDEGYGIMSDDSFKDEYRLIK